MKTFKVSSECPLNGEQFKKSLEGSIWKLINIETKKHFSKNFTNFMEIVMGST